MVGFTRPGKHTKNYGKSPFLMVKSTISMAMFNSYVSLPEGNRWLVKIPPAAPVDKRDPNKDCEG